MNESGTYLLIIIALCIAWPMWVMVLCRILKQPREADMIASFLGIVVLIAAEVSR
jgi:hypothetical protein